MPESNKGPANTFGVQKNGDKVYIPGLGGHNLDREQTISLAVHLLANLDEPDHDTVLEQLDALTGKTEDRGTGTRPEQTPTD